jgi:hypothetical protein
MPLVQWQFSSLASSASSSCNASTSVLLNSIYSNGSASVGVNPAPVSAVNTTPVLPPLTNYTFSNPAASGAWSLNLSNNETLTLTSFGIGNTGYMQPSASFLLSPVGSSTYPLLNNVTVITNQQLNLVNGESITVQPYYTTSNTTPESYDLLLTKGGVKVDQIGFDALSGLIADDGLYFKFYKVNSGTGQNLNVSIGVYPAPVGVPVLSSPTFYDNFMLEPGQYYYQYGTAVLLNQVQYSLQNQSSSFVSVGVYPAPMQTTTTNATTSYSLLVGQSTPLPNGENLAITSVTPYGNSWKVNFIVNTPKTTTPPLINQQTSSTVVDETTASGVTGRFLETSWGTLTQWFSNNFG